jgi:integrase
MSRRRMLPKHVSQFTDNRGKIRYRFRKSGQPTHYFQHPLGSAEFMAEYRACTDRVALPKAEPRRYAPGSIDDLIARYYGSIAFNRGKLITRKNNRSILEAFREHVGRDGKRIGDRSVAGVEFHHLDKLLAEKAQRHPFAAINLRKQLKRLFDYAVKCKMRPDNPAKLTEALSGKTRGFHTWTEEEIARYQAHHPLGTRARLALELYLWTGKRRSDGVQLGPQHIQDGCFYGVDDKTGKPSWIPLAPQLREAIEAMPPHDHLCYLVTDYGRPFTAKGFGNRMRKWCDEAGLPQCTTHGLRKAIARRLAETGVGNQGIKSITLHSHDDEVALYTRQADQRAMAKTAMGALSDQFLASKLASAS